MAVGIIVAALGNGKKVPQDLSVVGFDDSPFAAHVADHHLFGAAG